jgi:hypothetical protein
MPLFLALGTSLAVALDMAQLVALAIVMALASQN